jgi:hypothetical protein
VNDQSNSKVIDQEGNEQLDPRRALAEQTLAVDLARAEIDQAIATAHKYPRVLDAVVKQIETMSCYNGEAAENCIYSLPRGGKPIIGASIGFANILAAAWGNCIDAGRPTYVDRKERLVYAEGLFHDLQTNRRTVIHESRRISGKTGALYNDDMIAVTGKAAAAVARRNAILNAVPRAIWHPIWEQALRIVRGDQETFAERKDKALKAFSQFGVKPEQIFMVLGLKGDIDLTLEHVPVLRGMYLALRDGSATVEEMFDPRRMTGKAFEIVTDPLGDAADQTEGMGEETGGATASAAPAATGAAKPQQATPAAKAESAAQAPTAEAPGTLPLGDKPAAAAKVEPKAEEPKAPTTAAEYVLHWRSFCAAATSASQIKNQYAAERQLRKNCTPFDEEHFDAVNRITEDRVAELKK